jgi:hypothetical protein
MRMAGNRALVPPPALSIVLNPIQSAEIWLHFSSKLRSIVWRHKAVSTGVCSWVPGGAEEVNAAAGLERSKELKPYSEKEI